MTDELDWEVRQWLREFLGDEDIELELVKGDWKPEEAQGYDPYDTIQGKQRRIR